MPRIKSTYENFERVEVPSTSTNYRHGVDQSVRTRDGFTSRKTGIPMAFQVTSPFDFRKVLLPHALVMHVSPSSFDESFSKKIERIQTLGGFVEQHWGDELADISCAGSTGAFMNIKTGLTSVLRERTIAYDRYLDLKDLFDNNGSVYDPFGNIVLQGKIMLMYDRGTYLGFFKTFKVTETDESPFAFSLDFTFKVEKTILQIPRNQLARAPRAPQFQSQNVPTLESREGASAGQSNLLGQLEDAAQARAKVNQYQEALRTNIDTLGQTKEQLSEELFLASVDADGRQSNIGTNTGLPVVSPPVQR